MKSSSFLTSKKKKIKAVKMITLILWLLVARNDVGSGVHVIITKVPSELVTLNNRHRDEPSETPSSHISRLFPPHICSRQSRGRPDGVVPPWLPRVFIPPCPLATAITKRGCQIWKQGELEKWKGIISSTSAARIKEVPYFNVGF